MPMLTDNMITLSDPSPGDGVHNQKGASFGAPWATTEETKDQVGGGVCAEIDKKTKADNPGRPQHPPRHRAPYEHWFGTSWEIHAFPIVLGTQVSLRSQNTLTFESPR